MARLMARTRVLAAEVAEDTRRKIAALFGKDGDPDPPGGPTYRVLPRFGDDD